jgi:hypothetical protein
VLDRGSIRLDSARVNGLDFQVNMQGYRGHGYQLQVRNDPASGVWQDVGERVCGTDAQITLTDVDGASGLQRFYRVAVD